ncbi:MAG: methyltransferase [Bacteroidetes bacterium]|nr:MAG: methyltransferase [Bacteroidota bacterium]
MISYSSKYRTSRTEIMDDFNLQGVEMQELLTDLKRVNKMLGGNAITLKGINELLKGPHTNNTLTIIDIGCGDGEMLRQCAQWAHKKDVNVSLIGIDANAHILKEAEKRSEEIKNTTFKVVNVFAEKEILPEFDIALCTLFLHHFKEPQIEDLLNRLTRKAKVGVVINDLHRSFWAFWFFRLYGLLFLKSRIARHDGLVSVARGFKRKELMRISEKIKGVHQLKWKWAFRYQWIIRVIK